MPQSKLSMRTLAIKAQQRQILAMMSVDVWVQRDASTTVVDFDAEAMGEASIRESITSSAPATHASDDKSSLRSSPIQSDPSQSHYSNHPVSNKTAPTVHLEPNYSNNIQKNTANARDNIEEQYSASIMRPAKSFHARTETQVAKAIPLLGQTPTARQDLDTVNLLNNDLTQAAKSKQTLKSEHTIKSEQVAPFDLLGARYHDWVFLVDGKALAHARTTKLWQNMSHALSLTPEHLQFPICEGMHDKDSADASVAGFVFRLGGRSPAKVAALTPLPEGIDYDELIRVPYLIEMLEDSRQKKQFWQLISGKN